MRSTNTKKKTSLRQSLGQREKSSGSEKKNSNVTGYQKRIAQRPPKAGNHLDVYEFDDKQRKGRTRADVTLDLSHEEAREYGVEEESEQDDIEKMRQKLKIGEEGVVKSEDDEEIDSDDAFDQSDEERFGGHQFQSTQKERKNSFKQPAKTEVDLNEDEDMEDSDEDDDENMDDDDNGTEKDSEQGNSDKNEKEGDSDQEGSDNALQALGKYIQEVEYAAPSKKRKASELKDELPEPPQQRRRILKEQTQPGTEGEFASFRQSKNKLQFSDLIAPLASEGTSSSVVALTAAAKALNNAKAAPLSAPLPLRAQDRLDRQAAYEQTKEEVQKWEPTMRRIREADHLSFPLQAQSIPQSNIAELASNFKPETNLESAVDRLLKAAELRDQDLAKTEELQMQHLTEDEIASRRAELRKMRDLMFRAEIKAKRISKIKSKAYRKIQKKERTKQAEKLKEMGLGIDDETERMKMEVDRAKERATLKHKNNGKWAASMRNRGELDEDQRKEMQEMYERGERLKKKIAGVDSDEESSDGSDEDDDNARLDELAALANDDMQPQSLPARKGGLMEMKFMKDAERRDQTSNRDAIDSFKDKLGKLGITNESDEDNSAQEDEHVVATSRVGGRMSFNPGQKPNQIPSMAPATLPNNEAPASDAENPWLQVASTSSSKLSRAKNEILVGKNSNAATLSKNALKRRMRKGLEAVARAKDDSIMEIDVNLVINPPKSQENPVPAAVKKPSSEKNLQKRSHADLSQAVQPDLGTDDDTDNDYEVGEKAVSGRQGRPTAFEQRELVARAFAGDHVVKTRSSKPRKGAEMETDAPKEVDTTLPGWGSWGGAGITKTPPKPERIKRFPGVDPKTRQDYGKDHVIISEKKDKKAQKYLVKDLPFPYTSKAQFERRMETPLGMEWNTRTTFQKATLPRVVKKMGTVIEPLERLF